MCKYMYSKATLHYCMDDFEKKNVKISASICM